MIEQLQASKLAYETDKSNKVYEKDAVPEVWNAYKLWRTYNSNAYPYNADIEKWIIAQYHIPEELHDTLGREIYLAQHQNRREKEAIQDAEMFSAGFEKITPNVPYRGNVHVRAAKEHDWMSTNLDQYGKFVDGAYGSTFFIPKGRRTRGYSLHTLKGYYKAL